MTTFLEIQPRDPVVCRDGRPFGAGSGRRMRSQPWPSPSVTAGSIRTAVGKANGGDFPQLIEKLKAIELAGPFPVHNGDLFLPAPTDLVFLRDGGTTTIFKARPLAGGATDLPEGLQPVCLPPAAKGKPDPDAPAWWSASTLAAWLADETIPTGTGLRSAALDERTHLEIDPKTHGATDGMLYSTAAAVLDDFGDSKKPRPVSLAVRVTSTDFAPGAAVHPFGGERRLVSMTPSAALAAAWQPPANLTQKLKSLKSGEGVRMVLATPAVFAGGWRPGWTEINGVKLELVGVKIERWKAISGWSYEDNGPKPIRRTVPAGGVYFFKLVAGDASKLLWLESACDDEQDRRDGFGLATWGVWTPNKE